VVHALETAEYDRIVFESGVVFGRTGKCNGDVVHEYLVPETTSAPLRIRWATG